MLLSLLVLVMAGCQALGGVDFNAMLKQSLKVTSYEGSQSVEFKLLLKDNALADATDEEKAVLDLISSVKLELDHVMVAQAGAMSVKGKLSLGEKSIAFNAQMDDKLTVIDLEGAKRPIVLHMASLIGSEEEGGSGGLNDATEAKLTETAKQMMDVAGDYAIHNLPNPKHLSVNVGQEQVAGETVSGMKIHAELTGIELWDWAQSYVDALLSDKDGLKDMLTQLLDLVQSQSEALQSTGAESIFGSLPEEEIDGESIEEATDSVVEMLTELKDGIAETELNSQEELNQIFTKDTYVKGDLFIDSKLDIRKSVIEASIKPDLAALDALADKEAAAADQAAVAVVGEEEFDDVHIGIGELEGSSPIEGIWLKVTSDRWNVNGSVTPDQPTAPRLAIDGEQLMGMEGYEVLRTLEPDSVLYSLLRDQAHISKQAITMYAAYSATPPIITPDGITLIPLRRTVNGFHATIRKEAGTLVVYDDATGSRLGMRTGSNNVKLNGKTVNWSFPPTVINGVTYVPARDFVKAFGGTLQWNTDDYEDDYLVISREP
ncbi:copper amine oxidase N-terminal domain-containing protein [Paenibacillus sp. CF384]|uniref:copper amine oxidase N-terminal domain-containing protein n=1 Tax=Paenibacillus sp. CF384 TaxID=1884382 RepID=UPI000895C8A6|nr:copper amine oxidase N-terminal domain-containing protein [Paenibacillus sp. CF384]SDX68505.1 Copper amine oxidase N-terminal domain-containing protein [Paenibacillus sp. CF384]